MKVIISPEAENDLREIGDFIAKDKMDAAQAFVLRLKARCLELGAFPNAGKKRDTLRLGHRSVTEGEYLIFYFMDGDTVVIARIVHGKRQLRKALRER